jgi:hypothetical protein
MELTLSVVSALQTMLAIHVIQDTHSSLTSLRA